MRKATIERFEQQVEKYGNNPAVKTATGCLSYNLLNDGANQVAHLLLEAQGLSKNPVCILFGHDSDMIVGMMGVLKAGKTYIPLDPAYPEERLSYMLQDSRSGIIVTNEENLKLAVKIGPKGIRIINIDDISRDARSISRENPDIPIELDETAYIMYTSGSTGKPKGVMQTHRNIMKFIGGYTNLLHINSSDRLTLLSSYSHTTGAIDIFSALLNGATLFPYDIKSEGGIEKIGLWLRHEGITVFHSIPTLYRYCVDSLQKDEARARILPQMRLIVLGGEALSGRDVDSYKQHFSDDCIFVNLFGSTEIIIATAYLIDKKTEVTGATVPVGYPADGVKALLINEQGEKVPVFGVGEIVYRSKYLSTGYWNLPEKTSEVFGQDPEEGVRQYRSGDLGRIMPDGRIEFLGRKDFQVKIRGYRIEITEIEAVLDSMPGIKKSVVVAFERDEEKYLAAFYTVIDNISLEPKAILEYLRSKLPDYMLPAHFIPLEKLPLTPNGKIDRKALADSSMYTGLGAAPQTRAEYLAPRNEIETGLAEIWKEILNIEKAGINDNFFDLGGHSLKATVLVTRIQKAFDVELRLKEIFHTPVLQEMAKLIELASPLKYAPIEKAPEQEYYPVSSAQKRMYILNQFKGQTSYNIPGVMAIEGELQHDRFEAAIRELMRRHEVMRTSFVIIDGEPVQRVHPEVNFELERVEAGEAEVAEISRGFIRPFDLKKAPLIRIKLVKVTPRKYYLLFDIHHIIFDNVSMMIFLKEFATLYAGSELPELKIQYHDYAVWQKKQFATDGFKKQEEYWLGIITDNPQPLHMPLDFKRPERQTFKGRISNFTIAGEISASLVELGRRQNVTLNSLLFAIYTLLLHKYSGQTEIIIGSLVAGRRHADLEKIIGLFINFLPIRQIINPEDTFSGLLDQTNKRLLEAYENQDYPFEYMVERHGPKTDISRNPLFDTMLVFHNEFEPGEIPEIEGLKFYNHDPGKNAATLDLKLDTYLDHNGEIQGAFEYNTDLFKPQTIDGLLKHLTNLTGMIAAAPDQKIAALELFMEEEKRTLQEKLRLNMAAEEEKTVTTLAVSATFTAEPVADYIHWWCKQFDIDIHVKFAPFNQIFQELIGPESLLSANTGANLLLIRFEDFIRFDKSSEAEKCHKLEQNFEELTALLRGKVKAIPYFVGLFPVAEQFLESGSLAGVIAELNIRWRQVLEGIPNIHVIDFTGLKAAYKIGHIFDRVADQVGDLPFSEEFYAAVGATVARKLRAWRKEPFKVIALDCDNTLWKGVCGEDGALGVEVSGPYQELQRFMIQKSNEGMLLALCSKNNEADIWEVFAKNHGMILKKEHLVSWRINWRDKAANLKSIAEELNLGLESFIFIDDSAAECLAAINNCPSVLTLRLPDKPEEIPSYLQHVWAFDSFKVTAEDLKRREMYQSERKRLDLKNEGLTLTEFISKLELKVSFNLMERLQLSRVAQLTQRTNQFNLNAIRRTEAEIEAMTAQSETKCWVVEVSDRFGDYGLVGVVITREIETYLSIDSFLLSCRVLGRTVEDLMLAGLGRYCRERGLPFLEAVYCPTPKNGLFKEFLEMTGWEKIAEREGQTQYRLPVARIKDPGLAEFYYQTNYIKPRVEVADESNYSQALRQKAVVSCREGAGYSWKVLGANEDGLLHGRELLPLLNCTGELLLKLPAHDKAAASSMVYAAPETVVQTRLAALWSGILGTGKIGINDNFFERGGNSLRATALISKIHQEFNVELQLGDIFDNPTIKKLSHKIVDAAPSIYAAIEITPQREYYPLSSAQKRMYILNRIEGERISYNNPGAVRLEGNLDRDRLAGVVRELVKRHEAFRTSFEMAAEEPVQRLHPWIDFQVEYMESGENGLSDIIGGFIRPFDLSRAPLLRVGLIKITENSRILIFDMHHIISDGFSIELLTDEFIRLYNGEQLPEIRLCYKDFAVWQRTMFQTDAIKGQREFWQRQFNGEIPVISLPTDYQRPALQSFEGSAVQFELTRELSGKLNRLALDNGATLYMLLLAMFNVLLYKYTGQEDLVVGTPVSGRRHNDLENIIGMFVNTLALRNQPKGTQTFQAFLENVKENVIEGYENQDYQFEELVEQLEANGSLTRDLSRNPVFDVMFVLHNKQIGRGEIAGIRFAPYPVETGTAKFDLLLQGVETENGISFSLEYVTKLFKRETIERICGHFQNIVNRLVSEPGIRIDALEMITKAEKCQLLHEFNDTAADYPQEKTIHELLAEQAGRTPEYIAAMFEEASLTYRELNVKANQLARSLREKGVKPNSIVGIMVERSLEMLIGIQGILKAGGAYLPINPQYPEERIRYMLEDSKAAILLTQRRFLHLINPAGINCEILALEDKELYQADGMDLMQVNTARDLIYLIYTSGSTGNPKGVMLEHYSVVNRLNWMQKQYPLNETDIILQKTPFTFDVSVWELFWWLFAGAKVYFLEPGGEKDPALILKTAHKRHITTMHFVPSMMQSFLDYLETAGDINSLKSLRQVFVSGEALSPQLAERFIKLISKKLHNLYGPTEAAVDVSYFDCSLGPVNGKIPIGKPIDNIQLHILNKDNQLQPVGIPGELCISGHGLARGYLGRPELTAQKFIPNPFVDVGASHGTRIYRTGDLARRMPDGNIEFLGRLDHQVKVRGFRIELGEIENRLLRHDSVKEAVVMDHADAEGEKYLCAYLVAAKELDVKELREYLLEFLPEFMIPSYFVLLEKLPLTVNGKVDRKALNNIDDQTAPAGQTGHIRTGKEYVAPRDATELKLAQIWKDVLGIEKVGIYDNFFESGGHSLKAVTLVSKIHREFNVELALSEIFKAPTIQDMAKAIREASPSLYSSVGKAPEREYYPLSSAQKRMYILSRIERGVTSYNIPGAVMIEGELDRNRFEAAVCELVRRHESFRTSFEMVDGEPMQKIRQKVECKVEYLEMGAPEGDDGALSQAIRRFIRPFDLSKAPLLRIGLIRIAKNRHILIYDMHHIISDGASMGILTRDFISLYNGEKLTELKISYKDFSEWQNRLFQSDAVKKQEKYWLERFNREIPALNLPTDYVRPALQSYEGASIQFELDYELAGRLNSLALESGATLFIVLLAAFNLLLYKYSGQEEIIVGAPVSGRRHADLENVIGMFVNTLALWNNPAGYKTFQEFMLEVKQNALNAYENQDYQFEELVEKVDIRRDLSRNPLFNVMFILQNTELGGGAIEGLRFTPYPFESGAAKFDITLEGMETETGIHFRLEYGTRLFQRETMERMIGHFLMIVAQVTTTPRLKLEKVELLTETEKRQLLYNLNDTTVEYPKEKTIQELFEEQAARTPDKIAVVFRETSLTYSELNMKANQMAHQLKESGVKGGTPVGLLVERSLEAIYGTLAIVKAGASCLPLDHRYPEQRINMLLYDSGSGIVVKTKGLKAPEFNGVILDIDSQIQNKYGKDNLKIKISSAEMAYLIYTSGSTGNPKGVMINHFGIINHAFTKLKECGLKEEDIVSHNLSINFVASIWLTVAPLIKGSQIVLYDEAIMNNPHELFKRIEKDGVTVCEVIPSLLNTYLDLVKAGQERIELSRLRKLILTGERVSPELVNKFYQEYRIELMNAYGQSECSDDTLHYRIPYNRATERVPVGRPSNNTRVYIFGADNQIQPIGIPGELYISGDGLALGYLNNPELTAERFVKNPHRPEECIYRTGDLARWLADGNIEFIGRVDHQVKIRGFRIELGEIESRLHQHRQVKEAVVVAKEETDGNKYLCAYIVAEGELTVNDLRDYLSKQLPEYMIPAYYVKLEKLPLTPNGKIDRRALPEPEHIQSGAEYVAPRDETEARLAEIWKEILRVEKVGIHDNFFALGGHSLKATMLASRIHKEFEVELALEEIFKAPAMQAMAEAIKRAGQTLYTSIEVVPPRDYYPVSSAQKRMYILNQMEGGQTNYNIPGAVIMEGKVDRDRLETVFRSLGKRHESLQTSFLMVDGEPVQKIHREIELKLEYYEAEKDITEENALMGVMRGFIRPFDLSRPPLLRIGLIRIEENRHILIYDMHHIISDGASIAILVQEFMKLYNGEELPELRVQYKDFSEWQNRLLQSENIKKKEEYWLNLFAGDIPALNLPTDYQRPLMRSYEGSSIKFELNQEMKEKLERFARDNSATLYMVLLAMFNLLLMKYTGQEDIVIGSPIVGRSHGDLENIIGIFVNTLAMRNRSEGHKTFRDLLGEVRDNALKAYENQDYQFEELVEKLQVQRDLSRNPLFDVMFVLQNIDFKGGEIEGIRCMIYPHETGTAKFDLLLQGIEIGAGISFSLEYYTKLFKPETIERMAGHFRKFIEQALAGPDLKLLEFNMMTGDEMRQLLFEFNDTATEYPRDKTINELFEERADKTPENIAIIFKEQSLTYRELNNRANQLARALREKGIRPDSLVGLMVERSIEMFVAILGVIKAGGAYLPIDPEYPQERTGYILEDSQATVLLTQTHIRAKVSFSREIIDLNDNTLYQTEAVNPERINKPHHLVYTLYTSGTTGKPKGVMIEHKSLVNVLTALQAKYPLDATDGFLLKTTFTFDVSAAELFGWFLGGGRLIILEKGSERDTKAILSAIDKYDVTHINFVPSMFNSFLDTLTGNDIKIINKLKYIFVAGEAIAKDTIAKFYKITKNVILENLYGPTESTVYVTSYPLARFAGDHAPESVNVPIGRPLPNIKIYILDKYLNPVPPGITGELYISGEGLARGYLNRPELTAEKLIPNPLGPMAPQGTPGALQTPKPCYDVLFQTSNFKLQTLYRTGDLARWIPDGNIEFLGRTDYQVKIRGYRIELGEIENRLLKYEFVKEAAVMDRADETGQKYLCAYLAARKELTITELREYLAQFLPEYMIPAYFVQLEALPLNANGKLDRKALPEPGGVKINTGMEYVAPGNEVEQTLAAMWRKLLKLEKIGINDDFFHLGGNSLILIQLNQLINERYPGRIKVQDLFDNRSIKKLANVISSVDGATADAKVAVTSGNKIRRIRYEEDQ